MKLAQYVIQRFIRYVLGAVHRHYDHLLPAQVHARRSHQQLHFPGPGAGRAVALREATQQLRTSLAELYGLEGDLFTQYVNYLGRVVRFDFGPSFTYYPEPVSDILLEALPWTAGLLVTTTLLAWVIGNGIGLVAGYYNKRRSATVPRTRRHHPVSDSVLYFGARRHPGVWLLDLPLPLVADVSPRPDVVAKAVSILYNSFLPALTLVLAGFGWNVLAMKSLAVSTKEDDYVQFARLKGTTDRTRMTNYVFRNAMLPQITALVLSLGLSSTVRYRPR